MKSTRLWVQVMVGNEIDRVAGWFTPIREYAYQTVVLDDCSTDGTADWFKQFPGEVKVHTSPLKESYFSINEGMLRTALWDTLCEYAQEGDWILSLDTDQKLSPRFIRELPLFLQTDYEWIGCRLLDLWTPHAIYYRSDGYWSPNLVRLFRFHKKPFGRSGVQHAGNVPYYVDTEQNGVLFRDLYILHSGWCWPEKHREKQAFYMDRCPPGSINWHHAVSITAPPTLEHLSDLHL